MKRRCKNYIQYKYSKCEPRRLSYQYPARHEGPDKKQAVQELVQMPLVREHHEPPGRTPKLLTLLGVAVLPLIHPAYLGVKFWVLIEYAYLIVKGDNIAHAPCHPRKDGTQN